MVQPAAQRTPLALVALKRRLLVHYEYQKGKSFCNQCRSRSNIEVTPVKTVIRVREQEHLILPKASATIPFGKKATHWVRRLSDSGDAPIDSDHPAQPADAVTRKGSDWLDQPGFRQKVSSRLRQVTPRLTQMNDGKVAALQASPFKPIKPHRDAGAEIEDVARRSSGADDERHNN